MARVNRIDSNVTGLRYAEESDTPKVLPGSPVWWPLEPNSYNDFGGNVTTVARTPISDDRQNKKGVVTDLDAQGGFNTDLTQTNVQDLLQGFFFSDFRKKVEAGGYATSYFTSVAASDDSYNAASGLDSFSVGDLVMVSGFTDPANNGLKRILTVAAGKVTVAEALVDEASPPADAKMVQVGIQADTGDIDVDASGTLPMLTSTTLDFTGLGLIPGEWIYVGGDGSSTNFANAENNGFVRIKSITPTAITFDKTAATMVTEASAAETIQLFFGRVLINEVGTLVKRRTYTLERSLGAPDNSAPTDVQGEYLQGSVANELVLNFSTAEKLSVDLSFLSMDHQTVTGGNLKAGARPDLEDSDAYNSSNDVARVKMNVVDDADSNPTDMFAFITEASMTIGNNVQPNKAIGTIGAVDMTAGNFTVEGTMTVFFVDTPAIQAVRDNSSVTLDMCLVKDNAGIVIDMPLLTLGEGRANIEADQPITLPLGFNAAKGGNSYTLLMSFFDYLPTAAG